MFTGYSRPLPGTPVNHTHPLSRGLISHWLLGDGGAREQDISLARNHGTLQSFDGVPVVGGPDGGRALSFDGSARYIQTTNNYGNASSLTTCTLFAWFKTTTISKLIMGLNQSQDGSHSTTDRSLQIDSSGRLLIYIFDTGVKTAFSPGSVTDDKWHLGVGVVTTTGISLYLDGVLRAFSTTTAAYTGYSSSYWVIGKGVPGGVQYFNGLISRCGIYNRALSAGEVALLYAEPYAGFVEDFRDYVAPSASLGGYQRYYSTHIGGMGG